MGQLSTQMHAAAETLAAQIEQGTYEDLAPGQRFELRWLALGIEAWSDRVATLEAEVEARRCPPDPPRTRLALRFAQMGVHAAIVIAFLAFALAR